MPLRTERDKRAGYPAAVLYGSSILASDNAMEFYSGPEESSVTGYVPEYLSVIQRLFSAPISSMRPIGPSEGTMSSFQTPAPPSTKLPLSLRSDRYCSGVK